MVAASSANCQPSCVSPASTSVSVAPPGRGATNVPAGNGGRLTSPLITLSKVVQQATRIGRVARLPVIADG
jgi:hypothetical protein